MGKIWELDFYSRPLVDDNQKKLWEVLICEAPEQIDVNPENLFRYSQFCPNTNVNSLWLQEAIEKAITASGTTPNKIRFFRKQMNNMIVRACEAAGIPAAPSRRTYTIEKWLNQRLVDYYPQQPNYSAAALQASSVQYPELNAIPLPDALKTDKGDKWAIVTLEAGAFEEMKEWDISFGEAFPLSFFEVNPTTPIPGIIIFSQRSLPLAAWLSGLELGYCYLEEQPVARIRLETGASDSWILLEMTNPQTLEEAKGFEKSKKQAQGIHFLAIQSSPNSESFAGFWLMKG